MEFDNPFVYKKPKALIPFIGPLSKALHGLGKVHTFFSQGVFNTRGHGRKGLPMQQPFAF